jgi:hypothetical protein
VKLFRDPGTNFNDIDVFRLLVGKRSEPHPHLHCVELKLSVGINVVA